MTNTIEVRVKQSIKAVDYLNGTPFLQYYNHFIAFKFGRPLTTIATYSFNYKNMKLFLKKGIGCYFSSPYNKGMCYIQSKIANDISKLQFIRAVLSMYLLELA